jgi:uncharacterized protein HemY
MLRPVTMISSDQWNICKSLNTGVVVESLIRVVLIRVAILVSVTLSVTRVGSIGARVSNYRRGRHRVDGAHSDQ